MRKSHLCAIDGAVERLCGLGTDPTAGDKTLENGGHLMWTLAGLKALRKLSSINTAKELTDRSDWKYYACLQL
jgi:hypothetical protein